MLELHDLHLFSAYRAKNFEGRLRGPNNDRTIMQIDKRTGKVQFDSDIPGDYETSKRFDETRMLPVVSIEKFLEWAEKELTEEDCLRYYPDRKESKWAKS